MGTCNMESSSREGKRQTLTRMNILGVVLVLALALICSVAGATEPKRVMLLHSFGREIRPWSDYALSVRSELQRQSPWPLDITDQSLISARSDNQESEPAFVEYLRALFTRHPLDLVVCVGAPAASFVQRHRELLFLNTPMVFTAVEQRRIQYSVLTASDAVVPIRIDFLALVRSILQILPETKNLSVITGASPIERFWQGEIRREVMSLADRVSLTFYDDLSFEDILKHTTGLPPHSAILWESMIVDAAGVVYDADASFKRLHAVAKAPIFSYYEPNLGEGSVGGPYTAVLDTSRQTAATAVRILGGERPGGIRVTPIEFATPKFDWREMQRWGINQSRLPPGAEVEFREPSAWDSYRWQIIFICTVVLAQAGLISLLLRERSGRHVAEVQSRQRMSELARINRFSTAGELTASIAHEINQPLASIRVNAETMELLINGASPKMEEIREITADIRRDEERATEVIRRVRSLLRNAPFEPENVDFNGVVSETLEFASALAVSRQVKLQGALYPGPLVVAADQIQLQQVILNLIVNAMDAMADIPAADRHITVSTGRKDDFVEASISDSGPGIPVDKLADVFEPFFTTKEHGMGMGLSIARTIVEAHDGQLLAENQVKGGALFTIRLPALKATESC